MTGLRANSQDSLAERVSVAGLAVLAAIGFAASYETLRDLAASEAGFSVWLAPLVPLSFDLGLVVLSMRVLVAAREGRLATVTRVLVVTLALGSVAANVAAATSATGRLLHAVPPAMFVVCFESVVVAARRPALVRLGLQPPRVPHVRLLVWLLAPQQTWRAWRLEVLEGGRRTPVRGRDHPAGLADGVPSTGPRRERGPHTGAEDLRRTKPLRSDRHAIAVAALRRSPDITAQALADELRRQGHAVSVRTAQRVRAAAIGVSEPSVDASLNEAAA